MINDNKIYKDLFASVFIKKQKPQVTFVLKEINDISKKVNIYDVLNNWYIIDWKSLYNGWYLLWRIYLHDDIKDYETQIVNNEKSLIIYVNWIKVAVPLKNIKIDKRNWLKYFDFYLRNLWIDNTLYWQIKEWINEIVIKDNYWKKNKVVIKFNVIYYPSDWIPTPYLKEDVEKNALLFTNILTKEKIIKDLLAEENGIKADSLTVYNNNIWLNIGGIIYVKDLTGQTSVKINANGYKKIKIKDWHLIKFKEYNLSIDNINHTLPWIITADYDPINKVWFWFDKDWYLYYIDSNFYLKKLVKLVSKPLDMYIEPVNDGSYEIFVVDNGKIKVFNVSDYNTELYNISYDYGPDDNFNNKLYTSNIVSIDKHNDILYFIKSDVDWLMKVWFIPFYQTNIVIDLNWKDKVLNFGNKTVINMSMYKEIITPVVTIWMITDSTWKKYFDLISKFLGVYNINISGYVTINWKSSIISGLGTTNMLPYERIEIYKDWKLVYSRWLDTQESEWKKDIEVKFDYDESNTHIFVVKFITKNWIERSVMIPVIHEVLRIPIPDKQISDWTYTGTIKVLDKQNNILYSEEKKFLVVNNTIYTDIILYNSKFENNTLKTFNDIKGVQIMFLSDKGLENIFYPLENIISEYSLYSLGLVQNWKLVDVNDYISPKALDKLKAYVNSNLNGFVKKDDLVTLKEASNLSNYNWDTFGGLFICIDKDTADKLKFIIQKKYWAIYNELKKIENNKLKPDVEYLTKEVLDRIKWIKETKLQVCPTDLGNKFINVKDLLNK